MLLMSMCQSVFAEKAKSSEKPTCQIRINHDKSYNFILRVGAKARNFSKLSDAVAARDKKKCRVVNAGLSECGIGRDENGNYRIFETTEGKRKATPWVYSSLDKGSPDAQSTLDWLVSNGVCARAEEVKKPAAPSVDASAGALGAS